MKKQCGEDKDTEFEESGKEEQRKVNLRENMQRNYARYLFFPKKNLIGKRDFS